MQSKKKKKRDGEAFLDGYKPALLIEKRNPNLHLLEGYPSYPYDEQNIFFFQNEREKQKFVQQFRSLEKDSYEECCLVGRTLGYPQKSVEFFARNCEIEKETGVYPNKEIAISLIWAGFYFTTNLYILIEEAKWMWETYTHPKAIENPLYLWTKETSFLEVPYGDFHQLAEAREYIKKKRGLLVHTKLQFFI